MAKQKGRLNMYCKMVKEYYELKPGTKLAYQLTETKEEEYTEEQYLNYVNATPFFRRLGGSEYCERAYTYAGYLINKIISKSPDRKEKIIARFYFWNHSKNAYDKY